MTVEWNDLQVDEGAYFLFSELGSWGKSCTGLIVLNEDVENAVS